MCAGVFSSIALDECSGNALSHLKQATRQT
jgi:hypothetical protein